MHASYLRHGLLCHAFSNRAALGVHQGCCSSGSLHEPEHHDRASAGAVQLGSVGVALSVFGSATKLMNVPLLSVTTQIVATAVGSNEGAPASCMHACAA